jgi:hypothetical protein
VVKRSLERKAEPNNAYKIGGGERDRSRVCTFHHAGFVDGELKASFVELDMGFVGETYATEEEVELAGRARNSSEEWKIMLRIHLVGLGCMPHVSLDRTRLGAKETGGAKQQMW